MEKKPFISVIMPVYNCQNDVKKAIQSIQAQTLNEWELIVIDDCSSDNTCEVVEAYATDDSRIMLLKKEKNNGPGASKNMGIEKAKGKYITFCDGDDWIDENAFLELSNNKQFDEDAIMAGYYRDIYESNGKLKLSQSVLMDNMQITEHKELIRVIPQIDRRRGFSFAWNKLYKAEVIKENGIGFSDKQFGEDYDFNIVFFQKARSLRVLNKAFYHYVKKNTESLTEKYVPDFFGINKDRFEKMKVLMEQNDLYQEEIKATILSAYVKHVMAAITRLYDKRAKLSDWQRRRLVKEMLEVELSKEAILYAKPKGRNEIICNVIFKMQNITLLLLFGKVLWFMQTTGKTVLERMKG